MAKKQKCICSADLLSSIDNALNALEAARKQTRKQAKLEKLAIAAVLELEAQIEDAAPCKPKKVKSKKKKRNKKKKQTSAVNELQNRLSEARDGIADDLEMIAGVGPKLADTLNSLGIYHFDQIADWQEGDVTWVDTHLNFPGRIVRENWIEQAKALAIGGRDEYVKVFGKEPR